ncbi:MAG: hypothetical protein ACD_9C00008G0003 [uncultured bacterium]|nr:MAG: hypothetical protein ACD_9C00008G0003 [uncultured bacterium]KKQ45484.1 MAG: hypothetical protein US63_C0016G0035 [Candidatus Moranbacteria bacterium GW2011_GWC2_37_8]KKQ62516.1 MAG: hypothetical protein US82_C0010G0036 [Parcubacteria group bacterium GW2011_GWC1_38_22]KKQ79398.1 MAG: hypothetical protein UT03_C0058G0001 [Candidatus Moranbacteria bacterium GW2011_GWD2_38_7]
MEKFTQNKRKGFTLIELLIVIAIIGILASAILVNVSSARVKARDAKRKTQLLSVRTGLEMYYAAHGKYPPAGGCAYGTNCYVHSTSALNWIPALSAEIGNLPADPINNTDGPWVAGHYAYSYGNVSVDGQNYDLTAQLESPSDPDRCEVRHYTFYFDDQPWCDAPNDMYSKQIYEVSR